MSNECYIVVKDCSVEEDESFSTHEGVERVYTKRKSAHDWLFSIEAFNTPKEQNVYHGLKGVTYFVDRYRVRNA